MIEQVISGVQAQCIIEEAEDVQEYNAIRWFVDDKEILPSQIKMVIYNDEEQNEEDHNT